MNGTSRRAREGLALVELLLTLLLTGILAGGSVGLLGHFLRTLFYLPKAVVAYQVATDVLQQIVEGGPSGLGVGAFYGPQNVIGGLRYAVRGSAAGEGAIWLALPDQIGFRTSARQCVAVRLAGGVMKRSVALVPPSSPCRTTPRSAEEDLPYYASGGSVSVTIPTGRLFRYYRQNGSVVPDGSPPGGTVRRVDITFVAQTGNGVFAEGDARAEKTSSVTIRVP